MGGRREQTTCTVQCAAGPDCRARDQTVCALCGTHLNGRTHTSLIPSRRDGLDTHSTISNQTDVGMGWTRTVLPAAADGRRTDTHTQPAATVAYPTDASADIAHAQRRMYLPSAYPDTSSSKDVCEASLQPAYHRMSSRRRVGCVVDPYLLHYLMFPVTLDFKVWFQNVDPCISGGSTFQRAADIPTLFIGCVYRKSRLGAYKTK